jgi:hypothetical protein
VGEDVLQLVEHERLRLIRLRLALGDAPKHIGEQFPLQHMAVDPAPRAQTSEPDADRRDPAPLRARSGTKALSAGGDTGKGSTPSLAQCGSHCRTVVAVCSHVASASDIAVNSSRSMPPVTVSRARAYRPTAWAVMMATCSA